MDETSTTETLVELLLQTSAFQKEPETETIWLFRRQSDPSQSKHRPSRGESEAIQSIPGQEFDHPLPREKKILKLLYQAEKESGEHSSTSASGPPQNMPAVSRQGSLAPSKASSSISPMQKTRFILKRRIFPSLFVYKAFKKLPK